MYLFKIAFMLFFFFSNSLAVSQDFKKPRLEYLGSFQFDLNATYFIDEYKMFSDFGPGKIQLKDGTGGKVRVCNELTDVISNEEKTIALKVSCEILMSDNTGLYLQYYGRIVPTESFWKKAELGKTAKINDGINSWFTGVVFRTSSKKYSYLNNELIIGRGTSLTFPSDKKKGSVNYDFYKAIY